MSSSSAGSQPHRFLPNPMFDAESVQMTICRELSSIPGLLFAFCVITIMTVHQQVHPTSG